MGYRERYNHRRRLGYSPEKARRMAKQSDGCYIATSVYGSYDCPPVWVLRRYRDNVLYKTEYGRIFIRCYYAISPALVKFFGDTNLFKSFFKGILDKIVVKLRKSGFSDKPYSD